MKTLSLKAIARMINKKTKLKLEIVLSKLSMLLNILQAKLVELPTDQGQAYLTDYEKSQSNKIARRMQGSLRDSREKIRQVKHIIRG